MLKSVALCTYNGEKYLNEQLDSILQQTVPIDELIICDDKSTDGTLSILENFQSQHPDLVKIYRNETNLGYVKNFENAIMHCSGDLIFLSDQDDIWYENKVETVVKTFADDQNLQVICHNVNLLADHLPETNYWKARNFSPSRSNAEILEMTLLSGNIFPGMAMVLSREAKKKYFPLKKLNRLIIHDYELVIQSCNQNKFFALDVVLGDYRLHDNQNIGFQERNTGAPITAEDIYTRYNSISYIREMVKEFGLNSSLITQYQINARKYFNDYLNQFPTWKKLWLQLKMQLYYKIK